MRTRALATAVAALVCGCGSLFGVDFDDARRADPAGIDGGLEGGPGDGGGNGSDSGRDGGEPDSGCAPGTKPQGGTCVPKTWVRQTSGVNSRLLDVWGVSKNEILVLAPEGVYQSAGNGQWVGQPTSPKPGAGSGALWGLLDGTMVGLANGRGWRRKPGLAWEESLVLGTCTNATSALWASSTNDIYTVTTDGKVCRSEAGQWRLSATLAEGLQLNTVWGANANDVYVAGSISNKGVIYHSTGDNVWTEVARIGYEAGVLGMWGAGDKVYAVGARGLIAVRTNGGPFEVLQDVVTMTEALYAVWGSSANDVYIVGSGGILVHWDGMAWKDQFLDGIHFGLTGVGGSSADDVYIVGADGLILHLE